MKEYILPVLAKKEEASGIKTIHFSTEGTDISYKPGQYAMMAFPELVDEEEGNMRPFTLSSSPTEQGHVAITTIISDSKFKQRFNELKPGELVGLKLPFGRFTLDEASPEPIIMIAGGIGVTPFRSHIRYAADRQLPLSLTLLYSGKTAEELVFREEFNAMAESNNNIKAIYTITRPEASAAWNGRTGRIDEAMIKEFAPDLTNTRFYVCGPPAMVDAMVALLKDIGAKPELIKVEKFVGY